MTTQSMQIDWPFLFLRLSVLFGWLILVLPILDWLHQRFALQTHPRFSRPVGPLEWLMGFIKVLSQRHEFSQPEQGRLIKRVVILFSVIVPIIILSSVPTAPAIFWGEDPGYLDMGSNTFSLLDVFGLLFLTGLAVTVIGFSMGQSSLTPFIAAEHFFVRQNALIVIAISCLVIPGLPFASHLRIIIEQQSLQLANGFPRWGAVLNPIAFMTACIAAAIRTRQWFDSQSPLPHKLIKPFAAELVGTTLLAFKLSRSLEQLAIYAVITVVFLGGWQVPGIALTPGIAIAAFTIKIFILIAIIFVISNWLPHLLPKQSYRILLLGLLPIALLSHFLSLAVIEII